MFRVRLNDRVIETDTASEVLELATCADTLGLLRHRPGGGDESAVTAQVPSGYTRLEDWAGCWTPVGVEILSRIATGAGARLLRHLQSVNGSIHMHALARRCGTSPTAIVRMVKRINKDATVLIGASAPISFSGSGRRRTVCLSDSYKSVWQAIAAQKAEQDDIADERNIERDDAAPLSESWAPWTREHVLVLTRTANDRGRRILRVLVDRTELLSCVALAKHGEIKKTAVGGCLVKLLRDAAKYCPGVRPPFEVFGPTGARSVDVEPSFRAAALARSASLKENTNTEHQSPNR